MCTAISWKSKDTYFGRNLDLDRGYGECVVIAPRHAEFQFRYAGSMSSHYAMIGMAAVVQNYPLYYEATNEKGLSMAGLNFPANAVYHPFVHGKDNIAPFEFILWILGQCSTVDEAKVCLSKINLIHADFNEQLPLSPLHWMISDQNRSVVVESVHSGLNVYDNPFEVLTNNPPFEYHCMNMNNYMGLNSGPAFNHLNSQISLHNYSLGMGALGLPGDYSSASRFVRACFVKENSVSDDDEKSSVSQFFHLLNAVAMPKGCVWTKNGFEYTRYSSCCNVNQGIYYYVTYDDFSLKAIHLHEADLNGSTLWIEEKER